MKVIFDASIFIHANYHVALKYVSKVDSNELANSVASQISTIITNHFQLNDVSLVLDSDNCFRKDIYKDYKEVLLHHHRQLIIND